MVMKSAADKLLEVVKERWKMTSDDYGRINILLDEFYHIRKQFIGG